MASSHSINERQNLLLHYQEITADVIEQMHKNQLNQRDQSNTAQSKITRLKEDIANIGLHIKSVEGLHKTHPSEQKSNVTSMMASENINLLHLEDKLSKALENLKNLEIESQEKTDQEQTLISTHQKTMHDIRARIDAYLADKTEAEPQHMNGKMFCMMYLAIPLMNLAQQAKSKNDIHYIFNKLNSELSEFTNKNSLFSSLDKGTSILKDLKKETQKMIPAYKDVEMKATKSHGMNK